MIACCCLLFSPPNLDPHLPPPKSKLLTRFCPCVSFDSNLQESGVALANQTKKRSVHGFSQGLPQQKFNVNRACSPKEKHQNSQKWVKLMNSSFSFFFLVWFAGVTPEGRKKKPVSRVLQRGKSSLFSGDPRFFFLPKNKDWRVRGQGPASDCRGQLDRAVTRRGMQHLCDSTVAGSGAQKDHVLARKCE